MSGTALPFVVKALGAIQNQELTKLKLDNKTKKISRVTTTENFSINRNTPKL